METRSACFVSDMYRINLSRGDNYNRLPHNALFLFLKQEKRNWTILQHNCHNGSQLFTTTESLFQCFN